MFALTSSQASKILGYSALSVKDKCYVALDDSTYIADSPNDMIKYLEDLLADPKEYMIDQVSMQDVTKDFGDTEGSYALEVDAFDIFKKLAESVKMSFYESPYESFDSEEPEVFIIEVK